MQLLNIHPFNFPVLEEKFILKTYDGTFVETLFISTYKNLLHDKMF